MPNLQDILVGKLALRRDLVDPLTVQDCMAEQRSTPAASLGQLLVRRRVLTPAATAIEPPSRAGTPAGPSP